MRKILTARILQARVKLVVKSGFITSSRITLSDTDVASAQAEHFNQVLKGKKIQDIRYFERVLEKADCPKETRDIAAISNWLDLIFDKAVNKKNDKKTDRVIDGAFWLSMFSDTWW